MRLPNITFGKMLMVKKKNGEHVILDINLGGHATVVGDVPGNGRLDMMSKPWQASEKNAVAGKIFVLFLENVSR